MRKKSIRMSIINFKQNFYAYIVLGITLHVMINVVCIPLLKLAISTILNVNNIPYLSYTNFIDMLTNKPLFSISLLLVIAVILFLLMFQFVFLTVGVNDIVQTRHFHLLGVSKKSFNILKQFHILDTPLMLVYLIVILPLAGFLFQSSLTSKIQVPTFIWDFLFTKPWLTTVVIISYSLLGYLGLRLIYLFPIFVTQTITFRQAALKSFRKTRWRKIWSLLWRFALIELVMTAILLMLSIGFYFLQVQLDHQADDIAFTSAVINTTLLNLLVHFMSIMTLTIMTILVMINVSKDVSDIEQIQAKSQGYWLTTSLVSLVIIFNLGTTLLYNVVYFKGLLLKQPLTISHRGVDNGNGVQNTIPALEKTSKIKPDYIEMDVRETKDKQFVVMHDDNLKVLAKINRKPNEMTLDELKQVTVSENGYHAKIASFDDYIQAAEHHHQKLLVEIKTTRQDSKNMAAIFLNKYQDIILKNHYLVHTLNYEVVQQIKSNNPKINVSYILPFSFSFPYTNSDGYTMEQTTLNSDFVEQAHDDNKKVFAWTVNTDTDIDRMIFSNVDGIITDNLSIVKSTINKQFNKPTYADKMLINIGSLPVDDSQ